MVQFWFDLPEPFPNPEPIVDFDFNYDDVKVSSSGFALLDTCLTRFSNHADPNRCPPFAVLNS
ncbi:uncharacterized protein F5891DRAFT_1189886 [Suillus fuscotomentosus]|uniref:Uncharacterized protein n=1 Tax=Suillus fuscotomentosus TaxID=1912939 RepID=A0AAD4E4K1_9AGAM|nr:uncharacterized protein F5891DRAFT_1189886 [Suillus fuscotomentosus]KAG1899435.1 hypothetical protein F5891DRAFT_1189886 [Suillus fuscotomentosus]